MPWWTTKRKNIEFARSLIFASVSDSESTLIGGSGGGEWSGRVAWTRHIVWQNNSSSAYLNPKSERRLVSARPRSICESVRSICRSSVERFAIWLTFNKVYAQRHNLPRTHMFFFFSKVDDLCALSLAPPRPTSYKPLSNHVNMFVPLIWVLQPMPGGRTHSQSCCVFFLEWSDLCVGLRYTNSLTSLRFSKYRLRFQPLLIGGRSTSVYIGCCTDLTMCEQEVFSYSVVRGPRSELRV